MRQAPELGLPKSRGSKSPVRRRVVESLAILSELVFRSRAPEK